MNFSHLFILIAFSFAAKATVFPEPQDSRLRARSTSQGDVRGGLTDRWIVRDGKLSRRHAEVQDMVVTHLHRRMQAPAPAHMTRQQVRQQMQQRFNELVEWEQNAEHGPVIRWSHPNAYNRDPDFRRSWSTRAREALHRHGSDHGTVM